MDLQLSDPIELFIRIRECVARNDWTRADALAAALRRQTLPPSQENLVRYLASLQETLIAAKSARANALASLARLNAAAEFHNPASPHTPRHNSVASAVF